MGITLTNAILLDIDPPRVLRGTVRIDGGSIAELDERVSVQAGDEVVDCGGAVVLPGLVNGHTHLYSALAVGMPPPPRTPRNFREILELVWWRLDRALNDESVEISARIGAIEALRCGTTTLIDHHASPNAIDCSLDRIKAGLSSVGLRGVLCYEATDRNGPAGRDAGVEENRRFLAARRDRADGRFAGLVGAHASFTLDDDSLRRLADLADSFATGIHIHVAEDPCDEQEATQHRGRALIDRLDDFGLLRGESVFAHGTHLGPAVVERVNAAGVTMAHNARSNMNNAVGYAPVAAFKCPVMLGTDGIGADMFAEARAAWFISRHCGAGLTPSNIVGMLAASARRASAALGVSLGKLEPGASADIVVTDYVPFTELRDDNLAGHLLFGMTAGNVRHVMVGGDWALRDRTPTMLDEAATRDEARHVASSLWRRMAKLPAPRV